MAVSTIKDVEQIMVQPQDFVILSQIINDQRSKQFELSKGPRCHECFQRHQKRVEIHSGFCLNYDDISTSEAQDFGFSTQLFDIQSLNWQSINSISIEAKYITNEFRSGKGSDNAQFPRRFSFGNLTEHLQLPRPHDNRANSTPIGILDQVTSVVVDKEMLGPCCNAFYGTGIYEKHAATKWAVFK
ncbi:unnamed protein product [Ilex paraguariensis]|uniref:Uncharacterized protein n=1 Tax=Ilex paraguariensis TaxID=185542 RepID=A0ABC8QZB6_9AQUA